MDDGRLTDGKGRHVDFKNTILIMTSNIGSAYLQQAGANPEMQEEAHEQVMEALRGHFKPEFLNRVDDIIFFNPLGKEQLVKIVDLRLRDLQGLLAGRKITLDLTPKAKELVFTEGYDAAYGARPLKRAIQKEIETPLNGEGRVLVRYSGTQKMCRVMVEGPSEAVTEKYAAQLAAVVKAALS